MADLPNTRRRSEAMMCPMTDEIRRAVRVELARRDMTRADLAEQVGVSPQYMSTVLNGKAGKMPDVWAGILQALGLTVRAERVEGDE